MSRIGRAPVVIPTGITVEVKDLGGTPVVTVKKGANSLVKQLPKEVVVAVKEGKSVEISVKDEKFANFWGLSRTLIANMVQGLDKGYQKTLEINGVGFKAAVKGQNLELNVGFSHLVNFPVPKSVQVAVENNTKLVLKSFDKEALGQTAAAIRAVKPPEPYQGKGIKYSDEHIVRKEGKTAGK